MADAIERVRCETCFFYEYKPRVHQPEVYRTVCRRYPPKDASGGRFPEVNAGDWCGEYAPGPFRVAPPGRVENF